MKNNEYTAQAEKFLTDTETTLSIVEAVPQRDPLWAKKGEKHGIQYSVTLKNARGEYTFDFWNSIVNREILEAIDNIKGASWDNERVQAERILEKNCINWKYIQHSKDRKEELKKKYIPNAYDILACLSPLYEDTFEDFCWSYCYDTDSITAQKTFDACREQDRMLRKLFSPDELEALNEIA